MMFKSIPLSKIWVAAVFGLVNNPSEYFGGGGRVVVWLRMTVATKSSSVYITLA